MTIQYVDKPEDVQRVIENEKHVLVDMWAEWCNPCTYLGKELKKIDEKYGDKITIVKVDVEKVKKQKKKWKDTCPSFYNEYARLRCIPLLFMYMDGDLIEEKLMDEEDVGEGYFVGYVEAKNIEKILFLENPLETILHSLLKRFL